MWLWDAIKKVPFFAGVYGRFLQHLDRARPDLVVLTDYPGFHMVLAAAARQRGIPVLYFITPQYWAWGPWRMRRFEQSVHGALSILPFEPSFYRDLGVPCDFIGHPMVDQQERDPLDESVVEDVRSRPTLAVMPGSRRAEIANHLEGLLGVVQRFRRAQPDVRVVIPHRAPERLEQIRAELDRLGADGIETRAGHVRECLAGSRLAIAKSGTGSLEACFQETPTVIVYKLSSRFQSWSFNHFLSVPFIGAANLIAGRQVVPEICFRDPGDWHRIDEEVRTLWQEGARRRRCLADLAEVRQRMGEPGGGDRAAKWVVAALRGGS